MGIHLNIKDLMFYVVILKSILNITYISLEKNKYHSLIMFIKYRLESLLTLLIRSVHVSWQIDTAITFLFVFDKISVRTMLSIYKYTYK